MLIESEAMRRTTPPPRPPAVPLEVLPPRPPGATAESVLLPNAGPPAQ